MNLIRMSEDENYNPVGFKNKRKNLRQLPQVKVKGTSKIIDASKHAMLAGKRISKNGKTYWETRSNRTDAYHSNV